MESHDTNTPTRVACPILRLPNELLDIISSYVSIERSDLLNLCRSSKLLGGAASAHLYRAISIRKARKLEPLMLAIKNHPEYARHVRQLTIMRLSMDFPRETALGQDVAVRDNGTFIKNLFEFLEQLPYLQQFKISTNMPFWFPAETPIMVSLTSLTIRCINQDQIHLHLEQAKIIRKAMPNLETLRLRHVRTSVEALSHLGATLTSLILLRTRVLGDSEASIALPELESLTLDEKAFQLSSLDQLMSSAPRLSKIKSTLVIPRFNDMSSSSAVVIQTSSGRPMTKFQRFLLLRRDSLRELTVRRFSGRQPTSPPLIDSFVEFPNLEYLRIQSSFFSDSSEFLTSMPRSLRRLDIHMDVTNETVGNRLLNMVELHGGSSSHLNLSSLRLQTRGSYRDPLQLETVGEKMCPGLAEACKRVGLSYSVSSRPHWN